jgi:uncharacterized cupin superfamily protein
MFGRLLTNKTFSPDSGTRPRSRPFSTAVRTADVALAPTPIDPAWMLDGSPLTEAAEIARTRDGTTCVYLWQTTRATYRWEHESDETVYVLDGEAFVRDERARDETGHDAMGPERRLGPADVAFFPAGARTIWRVPERLRKVSTLTRPLPGPAAGAMRWLRAGKRLAGRVHRRHGRPMLPPELVR